jgi:hypothetical protein
MRLDFDELVSTTKPRVIRRPENGQRPPTGTLSSGIRCFGEPAGASRPRRGTTAAGDIEPASIAIDGALGELGRRRDRVLGTLRITATKQGYEADYETPPADIYAVYPERLNLSAKVACFVEHLRNYLGQHADGPSPTGSPW